jgi:hypothetical protein
VDVADIVACAVADHRERKDRGFIMVSSLGFFERFRINEDWMLISGNDSLNLGTFYTAAASTSSTTNSITYLIGAIYKRILVWIMGIQMWQLSIHSFSVND